MMKFIIYSLGLKGYRAITQLTEEYRQFIECIVIGKDLNIREDFSKELVQWCKRNDVSFVVQNKTYLSHNEIHYNIALGWRWLIQDVNPLIVFHDSLLPKYRGFNPLVTALINGDKTIGVSAIEGIKEFDAGGIYLQEKVNIVYPIKIKEAIDLIADKYSVLLNSIIKQAISGTLILKPQDKKKISYSLWRDEDDYYIDWNLSASEIKRTIDAVGYPYLGARTRLNNKVLIILDSEITEDVIISNRSPGKVLFKEDHIFYIVCGEGILKISDFYNELLEKIDMSNKFRIKFK